MSAHRSRRIDRRTAEHLLRGEPVRAQAAGSDAVRDLLAAASAPARTGELAREQAALAAFRAAHLTSVPQPRRGSMLIKTALAKLLTVKIAATAVTAVAAGGIAVAAATGNLPTQHGDGRTGPPTSTVSATTDQATHTSQAGSNGASDAADTNATGNHATDKSNGDKANGDKNAGGSGVPSPSLVGLCQAYTARAAAEQGKALENPAFTVLVTTAGGKDKVPAYCADLLGTQPGQSSAAHPTGKPTTHSTGPGQAHPTGKPGDTPPSTRPSH